MSQLTEAELIELTGAKRPSRQIKALEANGIKPFIRIDGKPVVTWEMVNRLDSVAQSKPLQQIDVSWM